MKLTSHQPRLFCTILLLMFGGLFLTDRLSPLVLPSQVFFFRGWEYVSGAGRYNIPRTHITFHSREYGDLGNMLGVSSFKDWRENDYTMDGAGYRNALGHRDLRARVFVAGDSFFAGAGNSDEDTVAFALGKALGASVTPYVPGDLSRLLSTGRLAQQSAPHLLVWGRVERNLTADDPEIMHLLADSMCFVPTASQRRITEIKDRVKFLIGGVVEYTRLSLLRHLGEQMFLEARFRMTGETPPNVVLSTDGSRILFYAKDVRLLRQGADERGLSAVADAIAHTADCLARRNIRLLFVSIPDKSHVEFPHVPASSRPQDPLSPNPLTELRALLSSRGVENVELSTAFREYARTHDDFLYWKDDTHWNGSGVRLAVKQMAPAVLRLLRTLPPRKGI